MKKHKICIVGGGLTGLISALVLSEKGLDIDLILENNTSKNKDLRVTAISEKNIEILLDKKNIFVANKNRNITQEIIKIIDTKIK